MRVLRLGLGIAAVAAALVWGWGCSDPGTGGGGTVVNGTDAAADVHPADLVLRNGLIATVDDDLPEAQAVAIADGRIVCVGSDAEVEAHIGSETQVIDLKGRRAIPGFIEGHGHLLGVGRASMILDCKSVANWGEIVAMVAQAAKSQPKGTWIVGRGWHQDKWDAVPAGAVDGVPTHHTLSAVSPDHPVLLRHASGHASFVNAKAMALAGITADTPDPAGGTIVRDAEGEATGCLRETAAGLLAQARGEALAKRSKEELREEAITQARLAMAESLAKGITSFHDAGASFATIDLFRELADAGELKIRLYVMVGGESNAALAAKLADYREVDRANGFLTVRAIKRYIDGALGSHGAWLLEPYADKPDSKGLATATPAHIAETAQMAAQHGYQLCTHAIGDRANREVLNVYEEELKAADIAPGDHRWRIEHAQHIDPSDVPRFAGLGVIAAVQAVHCTSDGPWVPKRLGAARAKANAYVWRSLLDAGAVVANGTDGPVEDIDPIACFYATVTRKMQDGRAFFPEQCLSREEALRSYTLSNAYAAFEERDKGSITVGKYADITVLSKDIMTVPEDQIRDAKVDLTIVAGKVAYER